MRRAVVLLLLLLSCRDRERLPGVVSRGPTAIDDALAAGASIDETIGNGTTALHVAAAGGDAEAVAMLLARGARADAKDGAQTTALALAARRGTTACIAILARATRDIDAASGQKKRTALHDAVLTADADAVRELLAAHADVLAKDADGKTPLHLVAGADPFRVALIAPVLLAAGADPTTPDKRGMTPIHLAAHADDVTFINLVRRDLDIETPLGETPLDLALRYHRDAAAEALILRGAKPKRVPFVPPLHDAARTDDLLRATTLLALGVDRDRIADGKTALDIARATGSVRVAALLVR
jgi:ankyrin repeat protein